VDRLSTNFAVYRIQHFVALVVLLLVLPTSAPRPQTPDDTESTVAELQIGEYTTVLGNLEVVATGIVPPVEVRVALSGYTHLIFFWEVSAPSLVNDCR